MRDRTLALGAPGPFARLGQMPSLRDWANQKNPALSLAGSAGNLAKKAKKYGEPMPTPWGLSAAEIAGLTAVMENRCDHTAAAEKIAVSPKTLSTYLTRAAEKMDASNNEMAVLTYALWKAEQAKTKETEPCGSP